MPPSIVLEILKITEAEMDLREKTRETEQSRRAMRTEEYAKVARALRIEQSDLTDRTDAVTEAIRELPDGESEFGKEIDQLERAAQVMDEATSRLRRPETGAGTIAAESEAIEILLEVRRGRGGGGGGGSNPGGGRKGGSTDISALAMAGRGDDPSARPNRREVDQATGKSGGTVPAEFRSALDRYFADLEKKD